MKGSRCRIRCVRTCTLTCCRIRSRLGEYAFSEAAILTANTDTVLRTDPYNLLTLGQTWVVGGLPCCRRHCTWRIPHTFVSTAWGAFDSVESSQKPQTPAHCLASRGFLPFPSHHHTQLRCNTPLAGSTSPTLSLRGLCPSTWSPAPRVILPAIRRPLDTFPYYLSSLHHSTWHSPDPCRGTRAARLGGLWAGMIYANQPMFLLA